MKIACAVRSLVVSSSRKSSPASAAAAPQVLRYGLARSVYLSRAIHSPIVVPNLYAGISEGGEQAVSTGSRFAVGPTRNHVELCNAVG